jgi:hypothetical protein
MMFAMEHHHVNRKKHVVDHLFAWTIVHSCGKEPEGRRPGKKQQKY